jgi:hypothetical protein
MVPGISRPAGLGNVESRGTFSAAAAMAFGAGSSAQEETATNTRAIAKFTKKMADKPSPVFTH